MSIESATEFATVHEIIKTAHKKLPRGVWDYVVGGTDTETTLRRNRMALDSIAFRPRVMRDVTRRKAAASFMGKDLRMPVILAPVGSLEMVEPGGAATSAKAAELFNVVHMLSSRAEPGLEGTAAAADNHRIFQLYIRGDDDFEDDHVKRAIDNGYFAFAITVDLDIYTRRERDHANRYGRIRQKATEGDGFTFQAAYTWDNVKRFKDKHNIPLILKGIGSVEDAAKAVEHGVEGVYVSNHGGRALDTGRGAIEVLPEIVAEIGGKAKIIYDGGVMRGSDIVKAMILGADAVGVGRLQCLGMAAAGVPGLLRVLELLEEEILIAFGLMGVNGWDELDGSYICPAEPVDEPHVFSQHPMVQLEPYRY
jgi:glycolate oxidase